MFKTIRNLVGRVAHATLGDRRRTRRTNCEPAMMETLESRETLTLPSISTLISMFANQVNTQFNSLQSDVNAKINALFTNEVEPLFTGLEANFMTLNPEVNTIISGAVSSLQGNFNSTFTTLSADIDQADNWIKGATPAVSMTVFPLTGGTVMPTPMPNPNSVFVYGDQWSFYADALGIRSGNVDKVLDAPVVGGNLRNRWKLSLMDGVRNSIEYEHSLTTPLVSDSWIAKIHNTFNQPRLEFTRGYNQIGGPVSLNANGIFDPSGMLSGGINGKWKTDPFNADFNVNRVLPGFFNANAKVNLGIFDTGLWKPYGAVGYQRDFFGNTTTVAGIQFEHPNGQVSLAKANYTPLLGASRTYWTMKAVYQKPSGDWVHTAQYLGDSGSTMVLAETLVTPNFSLGLLGTFRPQFGLRVTYVNGVQMFEPVSAEAQGFNAEVIIKGMKWK